MFQTETKTLIDKLEINLMKLYRQNVSLLFNVSESSTNVCESPTNVSLLFDISESPTNKLFADEPALPERKAHWYQVIVK